MSPKEPGWISHLLKQLLKWPFIDTWKQYNRPEISYTTSFYTILYHLYEMEIITLTFLNHPGHLRLKKKKKSRKKKRFPSPWHKQPVPASCIFQPRMSFNPVCFCFLFCFLNHMFILRSFPSSVHSSVCFSALLTCFSLFVHFVSFHHSVSTDEMATARCSSRKSSK